jgi:hypothetical protein
MATRMQQRKGTAAQWAAADPILNAGEIGWESDTNKFKIGDGTNHWDDLTYFLDATDMGGSFSDYVPLTQKNAANGVAQLNADINVMTKTAIEFEGATADAYETTLSVVDPTEDRAITLPNASGTVALTSDITVTASSTNTLTNKTLTSPKINEDVALTSTATELNLIDGSVAGTVVNGKAVVYGATGEVNATTLQIAGTSITSTAAELNLLDGVTASTAELNYVDGVTSDIQTQLNSKAPLADPTFTGTVNAASLTLSGDLTVNGTTTNINSTNLVVEDKNIVIGDTTSPSDATADGGGLTLKGSTDKTLNWVDATDAWTSSEHVNIVSGKSYKINNVAISTALPALTWGDVKNGKSGLVIS